MKLLLASQSASRRRMLEAAGVPFGTVPAVLDEEEAKAGLLAAGFEPLLEAARGRQHGGRRHLGGDSPEKWRRADAAF